MTNIGVQSIPAFDFYMAPGILKTFKKQFKQIVYDYLELTDFDKFIAINGIEREIEKISTIDFDVSIFYKYCRESQELKRMFNISYKKALEKTNKITYQSMEAFIHNLNTVNSRIGGQAPLSSICFGTDTSPEGRMVCINFLEAMEAGIGNHETAKFPISIFKIKEGVNYLPQDANYDIFKRACEVSLDRGIITFEFLDSSFNKKFYSKNNYDTEVAYMGYRTRVMENMVDTSKEITPGRGILSVTSINLPRIGIKNGTSLNGKANLNGFFQELEEKLDLVKDQLLERFEMQCSKKVYNFPFLLGQALWIDSEKLKETDNLKKVLKQGTMSIGFTGLAECLKALTGKHHGESKEAQELGLKIISFMREKCDKYSEKYNLNFSLTATPSGNLSTDLIQMDQAIYGKIKNITDKEIYTDSFQLPKGYKISAEKKIEIEAPYHKLTNGGHITEINLPEDAIAGTKIKIVSPIAGERLVPGRYYERGNMLCDYDPYTGWGGNNYVNNGPVPEPITGNYSRFKIAKEDAADWEWSGTVAIAQIGVNYWDDVKANQDNYQLKFEVNTLTALSKRQIRFFFEQINYDWEPFASGLAFKTNGEWQTISIDLNEVWKGDVPNTGTLQVMGNSFAEDTDICFDNFRIVPKN